MTEQEKIQYFDKINKQFHFIGKIMTILSIAALLSFSFIAAAAYGVWPSLKGFLAGFANVAVIYYPVAIAEFLIFAPMLGTGGSYLAFLTGNLTNLKIPCAMNARDIAKVETGTPENEIISTLSISASAITTMLIIFAGVLLLTPLRPILEKPELAPAFDNVVAALFGALGLKYFLKQPKIAVVPLIMMTLLCILVPSMISQTSILIIPAGLLALGIGYILFKKEKINV